MFSRVRIFLVLPIFFIISACGTSTPTASKSLVFKSGMEKALLIGGAVAPSGLFRCMNVAIYRIDPNTHEIGPDAVNFKSSGGGLQVYELPPGGYLMNSHSDCVGRPVVLNRPNFKRKFFQKVTAGSFEGAYAPRFVLNAGEVVYIGHFNGRIWLDRREEAKELLSQMENVSVPLMFKPPRNARTFEEVR